MANSPRHPPRRAPKPFTFSELCFPSDFEPCTDSRFFERPAVDLVHAILGQFLYCHTSRIMVQITEVEAYSDSDAEAVIYNAMFGPPPCAQFQVRAGQIVCRTPTVQQPRNGVTSAIAARCTEPLELYITAGVNALSGDVILLKSILPVSDPAAGIAEIEKRLDVDDVVGNVIGASQIGLALGAGADPTILDWEENPYLYLPGGIQMFHLRQPEMFRQTLTRTASYKDGRVVSGRRDLDPERVGHKPEGWDAEMYFALNIDGDIENRS